MELLARFFFDGGGIGFERLDLIGVLIVFFLHALNLTLQRLHLGPLLPIHNHAVGSEHGVQHQSHNKENGSHSSQTTPLHCQPRPNRTRTFNATAGQCLRLRSMILGLNHRLIDSQTNGMTNTNTPTDNRAESFLCTWKDAYSRRWS
jgi:hypothetical protein